MEIKDINVFRKFSHEVSKGFKPELDTPLNRTEVQVLVLLETHPDAPMHKVSRMVGLERGSFTYLVDLLTSKGLAERVHDEVDRRRKTLALTDAGKAIATNIKKQHKEYLNSRYSEFSEDELKELNQAVETVEKLLVKLPKVEHKDHGPEGRSQRPNGRSRRPHKHPHHIMT